LRYTPEEIVRKIRRAQHHRIRRILAIIRKGTASGRYPNTRDFSRELEVSRQTIVRDLDFLRDEEGAPIEYVDDRWGYRLTDPGWQLSPVTLSTEEVFAFSVGRKALEAFEGTPLDLGMRSMLNKIATSLQGNVTLDMESMTDHMTVVREDYVNQDMQTWREVAGCVDRREGMRIRYQRFDGETKHYVLAPYHMFFHHGNWYVVGGKMQDAGRREPGGKGERAAMFAVSRVRSVERTGEYFKAPEWFDPKEYIKQAFGIVRGDKIFKVRLLFARKIATYIEERQWHPTQQIISKRDGSIELRFETAGWKELVRWILSWQPDVKVISPKRLGKRIEEKMRQALSEGPIPNGK